MAGLAWHGMVWLGVRARCFHNEVRCYLPTQYLKIEFRLSVKSLQLPLQGSGKALGDNLEGACSIFLQKGFILVRRIYWIFRLLRGGWLGCTRATTHPHCHCTPRHPRARARSPRLVKPRHGWLGLAWYGMAWCESQVLS